MEVSEMRFWRARRLFNDPGDSDEGMGEWFG